MKNNGAYEITRSAGAKLVFVSPSQPLASAHDGETYDDDDDNDSECVVILKHLGTCDEPLSYVITKSKLSPFNYIIRPQRGIVEVGESVEVDVILSETQKEIFRSLHTHELDGLRQEMADSISVKWNTISKPKSASKPKRDILSYNARARKEKSDNTISFKVDDDLKQSDPFFSADRDLFFSPLTPGSKSIGVIALVWANAVTELIPSTHLRAGFSTHYIAFKISVTHPARYTVRPAFGIITSGSRTDVTLTLGDSTKKDLLDMSDRNNGSIPSSFKKGKLRIEYIPMNDLVARNILDETHAQTVSSCSISSNNELKDAFTNGWEDSFKYFQISKKKIGIQHPFASPVNPSIIKYPTLEIELDSKHIQTKTLSEDQPFKRSPTEKGNSSPPQNNNVLFGEIVTPLVVAEPIPFERPVIIAAEVVRAHDSSHNQIISNNTSPELSPPATATSTSLELPKENASPSINAAFFKRCDALLEKYDMYTIEFKSSSSKACAVGLFLIIPVFVTTWFVGLHTFLMIHAIFFVPEWNLMKEKIREDGIEVAPTRDFLGSIDHTYAYKYKYSFTDPGSNENLRFQMTIRAKLSTLNSFMKLVVLPRAPNMPYRSSQLKSKGLGQRISIFLLGFVASYVIIALCINLRIFSIHFVVVAHVIGAILSPLVFIIQKQFFLCHWNIDMGRFIWDPCNAAEV